MDATEADVEKAQASRNKNRPENMADRKGYVSQTAAGSAASMRGDGAPDRFLEQGTGKPPMMDEIENANYDGWLEDMGSAGAGWEDGPSADNDVPHVFIPMDMAPAEGDDKDALPWEMFDDYDPDGDEPGKR